MLRPHGPLRCTVELLTQRRYWRTSHLPGLCLRLGKPPSVVARHRCRPCAGDDAKTGIRFFIFTGCGASGGGAHRCGGRTPIFCGLMKSYALATPHSRAVWGVPDVDGAGLGECLVSFTCTRKENPRKGPEINPSTANSTLDWGNWVVFN